MIQYLSKLIKAGHFNQPCQNVRMMVESAAEAGRWLVRRRYSLNAITEHPVLAAQTVHSKHQYSSLGSSCLANDR